MARASLIQNTVNAGELSTLLLGRQDIAKYVNGLRVCFNGVPLTQGAWTRRPGTVYLAQTRHHDKHSRLVPFQYSVTQTYILEFGEHYIRFFTNHGLLTGTAQDITGISKASTAVLTYSGADNFANGDRVYVTGVAGMTQVNGCEFVVTSVNTGANTFQLYDSAGTAVNSSAYDAWTSGGTVAKIYEVTTTYDASDMDDLRFTQSADTLYIFHPDFPPATLVRNSASSWTLSDVSFQNGPYGAENTTSTSLSPDAATGTVTVTASAATGINGGSGFVSTDVGRLIRMREGTEYGWAEILTVGSTVSVTAVVRGVSTLTNTNAKTNWQLGIWSDTTGWPTCATFYEDRLVIAGAATSPQRLDGSRTGRYADFSPSGSTGTVADSDAVAFTLNSDDVNAIKWVGPHEKGLLVGTVRGEWVVRPSALTEAITPTNISAKPCTRHGSSDAAPVFAGKAVLFPQRTGRKLRELAYVFEADGFTAPDMTLLSEHITSPSIDELAYQEQPQAIVWAVRSDGALLGFTYERSQDVVAWHRHELGGYSNDSHSAAAVVERVAVIPSPDDDRDELYMIVRRRINGVVKRYVEYMSKLWEEGDELEDALYLDSCVSSVFATSTWTSRTTPTNNDWNSVAYGNGTFVAVAFAGSAGRVMSSPDGITWTQRTAATSGQTWSSVAYGAGLFVAVGYGTTTRVMTSPDGITWTARTAAASNNWAAVTFGDDDQFVAVAASGTNRVMTSPDGITWTARTSSSETSAWGCITYGNGRYVAFAATPTAKCMTSTDGITWTTVTTPTTYSIRGVAYGNGRFVAVGVTGVGLLGGKAMTSEDGFEWVEQSGSATGFWTAITFGGGQFAAVQNSTSGGATTMQFSADGETWSSPSIPLGINWWGIVHGEGTFVAVGADGTTNEAMSYLPTTVTGLNHLEGETVTPFVDGAEHDPVVVSNGKVTLDRSAVIVSIGYPYDSDGQTLPPEGGSRDGTSQGKIKRISQVAFWLADTLGMQYGRDEDNLTDVAFDSETELFTGVTSMIFEGDYDMLGQVYWRCGGPFPATVLSIMPSIRVAD